MLLLTMAGQDPEPPGKVAPQPCHSPVLPGIQLHGLCEGLHCLSVSALLGCLVATACGESIARC